MGRRERRSAGPDSLDAFRKPPPPSPPPRSSSLSPRTIHRPTARSEDDFVQVEHRWSSSLLCLGSQQPGPLPGERMEEGMEEGMEEEKGPTESTVWKTYLETDIDSVRREDELKDSTTNRERTASTSEKERTVVLGGTAFPTEFWEGTLGWIRNPSPALSDEGLALRYDYQYYSLPRGINTWYVTGVLLQNMVLA
ncbi:hypothetical protein DPEC_G00087570 [Dallia pectoralis]|uniref:Uncharacterized protein n=1 Tax=Dallia pectoralis TaxID=75939 RepID=A0ACC2H014_DALPE|nr:hypothetical protein DPEC_G00087570 [Dallia pectoralis]